MTGKKSSDAEDLNPFTSIAVRANDIGCNANNGDIALNADEIELLYLGIAKWPEFLSLSKTELESLKFTFYTLQHS